MTSCRPTVIGAIAAIATLFAASTAANATATCAPRTLAGDWMLEGRISSPDPDFPGLATFSMIFCDATITTAGALTAVCVDPGYNQAFSLTGPITINRHCIVGGTLTDDQTPPTTVTLEARATSSNTRIPTMVSGIATVTAPGTVMGFIPVGITMTRRPWGAAQWTLPTP